MENWSRYNYQSRLVALPFIFYGADATSFTCPNCSQVAIWFTFMFRTYRPFSVRWHLHWFGSSVGAVRVVGWPTRKQTEDQPSKGLWVSCCVDVFDPFHKPFDIMASAIMCLRPCDWWYGDRCCWYAGHRMITHCPEKIWENLFGPCGPKNVWLPWFSWKRSRSINLPILTQFCIPPIYMSKVKNNFVVLNNHSELLRVATPLRSPWLFFAGRNAEFARDRFLASLPAKVYYNWARFLGGAVEAATSTGNILRFIGFWWILNDVDEFCRSIVWVEICWIQPRLYVDFWWFLLSLTIWKHTILTPQVHPKFSSVFLVSHFWFHLFWVKSKLQTISCYYASDFRCHWPTLDSFLNWAELRCETTEGRRLSRRDWHDRLRPDIGQKILPTAHHMVRKMIIQVKLDRFVWV